MFVCGRYKQNDIWSLRIETMLVPNYLNNLWIIEKSINLRCIMFYVV